MDDNVVPSQLFVPQHPTNGNHGLQKDLDLEENVEVRAGMEISPHLTLKIMLPLFFF